MGGRVGGWVDRGDRGGWSELLRVLGGWVGGLAGGLEEKEENVGRWVGG